MATSERLARRWFATIQRGAYDELDELVHEDVELSSKLRPGTTVHGRSDVVRFIETEVAPNLFEASTEVFTPLDDDRVIVEGRVRWIDDVPVSPRPMCRNSGGRLPDRTRRIGVHGHAGAPIFGRLDRSMDLRFSELG